MKPDYRHRTFQGIDVRVEYDQPHVGGARITLPDSVEIDVRPTSDHPRLDTAICFNVNLWRHDKWEAEGKRHAF